VTSSRGIFFVTPFQAAALAAKSEWRHSANVWLDHDVTSGNLDFGEAIQSAESLAVQ
jgi:hypothetical protein